MAFGPRIELPPIKRDGEDVSLALDAVGPRHFGEHIPTRREIQAAAPYISPSSISMAASLRKKWFNSYYDRMKADPQSIRWGVLMNGTLNGFAGYQWREESDEASIFIEIYKAQWQGQRVGSAIGPVIVNHAFESGFDQLSAKIDLENEASLRLATKIGFVCVKHDYYADYGRDRKMHHLVARHPDRMLHPNMLMDSYESQFKHSQRNIRSVLSEIGENLPRTEQSLSP